MAKIQHFPDLGNLNPQDFVKHGSQVIQNTVDQVNGNLEFDKNIKSQTVVVKFAQPNIDMAVSHKLNKVSVHYMVVKKNVDCSIYDGVTKNTSNIVYLRSTQASTVTLVLF